MKDGLVGQGLLLPLQSLDVLLPVGDSGRQETKVRGTPLLTLPNTPPPRLAPFSSRKEMASSGSTFYSGVHLIQKHVIFECSFDIPAAQPCLGRRDHQT